MVPKAALLETPGTLAPASSALLFVVAKEGVNLPGKFASTLPATYAATVRRAASVHCVEACSLLERSCVVAGVLDPGRLPRLPLRSGVPPLARRRGGVLLARFDSHRRCLNVVSVPL